MQLGMHKCVCKCIMIYILYSYTKCIMNDMNVYSEELGIGFNQMLMLTTDVCLLLIRVKWPFHHNSNQWNPRLDPSNGWTSPASEPCFDLLGIGRSLKSDPGRSLEAIFVYLATKCCKFLNMHEYIHVYPMYLFPLKVCEYHSNSLLVWPLFSLISYSILQHLTASQNIAEMQRT